jgi:hypothetical protein
MTGAMTNFKDPIPLEERDHTQNPVLPSAQRDRRCDDIITESEWVIEEVEEKTQECPHQKRVWRRRQTLALGFFP